MVGCRGLPDRSSSVPVDAMLVPLLSPGLSRFTSETRDVRGLLQFAMTFGGQLVAQFGADHLVHGGFLSVDGCGMGRWDATHRRRGVAQTWARAAWGGRARGPQRRPVGQDCGAADRTMAVAQPTPIRRPGASMSVSSSDVPNVVASVWSSVVICCTGPPLGRSVSSGLTVARVRAGFQGGFGSCVDWIAAPFRGVRRLCG
jgi:hypothetical protein